MISFLTGKPGGGKGLLSMKQIVDELVQGTRHIICNTPVRLIPWVFGNGQPMMGLAAYLKLTYGKTFDCEKRVHILDDDDIASFYLWRVVDGKLQKAAAEIKTSKEGEERIMSFDTSLAAQSGGVMYVIDEAWKFYGSRNWQKTGEGMLFYSAQHRHFGDDVFIVTQHTKQIDPAIQRVAQDFWVVTNHSKLSLGIFRQPDIFSVAIYDQAPTGGSLTPMSRKVFKLDKKGLAQTYDTSAGVGLTGRLSADIGARKKGLPWWGLVVVVFGLGLLTWYGVRASGWLFGHALLPHPAKAPPKSPMPAQQPPAAVSAQNPLPAERDRDPYQVRSQVQQIHRTEYVGQVQGDTNTVYCTGYFALGGDVAVYLSDGSTAYAADGEVQEVTHRWVTVFGHRYRVMTANETLADRVDSSQGRAMITLGSLNQTQPEPVGMPDLPTDFVRPGSVEILPSINSQASAMIPPPRINGFNSLGQNSQRSPGQQSQY